MDINGAIEVFTKYIDCRNEEIEKCFSHNGCGGCPHALTDADITLAMRTIIDIHSADNTEEEKEDNCEVKED